MPSFVLSRIKVDHNTYRSRSEQVGNDTSSSRHPLTFSEESSSKLSMGNGVG